MNRFQYENDESQMRTIDAISFFKKGIKPIWEDDKNFKGHDLSTKFIGASATQIDEIYWLIIIKIFCEEFPYSEQMNGFRFADKGNTKKSGVRLEVWFDEISQEEQNEIQKFFVNLINEKWSNPILVWKPHSK